MSNILKSIVGLAIIASSIGLAATPAKAESKTAQCKRFDQAMNTFAKPITSISKNRSNNPMADADQMLSVLSTQLKQLQSRQFSDPKIRGFQQSALNIYVDAYNNLANLTDAAERGDQATTINSYQQLLTSIQPEARLQKQFVAYCGRPK
jgi:16S rRNA C1402 N4-methylase RsmH